jgi:flavodoxin
MVAQDRLIVLWRAVAPGYSLKNTVANPFSIGWRHSSVQALVIYDSQYGNTEKIANAIGTTLGAALGAALGSQVETILVRDARLEQLVGLDLLIVGAPTQRFRTTEAMLGFLKSIPVDRLKGVRVAAFDTRLSLNDIESSAFRFIVKTGGFAAKHIADRLKKCGGEMILPPEGFLVKDMEGPLLDGELERAAQWAQHIVAAL